MRKLLAGQREPADPLERVAENWIADVAGRWMLLEHGDEVAGSLELTGEHAL